MPATPDPDAPTRRTAAPGAATRVRAAACAAMALAGCLSPTSGLAQSLCSSDGQPAARVLRERFISADCESCWSDPRARAAARSEVALDWIVASTRGADAALSAAATRDAGWRLEGLGRALAADTLELRSPVAGASGRLRVAHGLAFNGYIGTSISFTAGPRAPSGLSAWVALVETIGAGTEGTPIERNLVRNTLQLQWNGPTAALANGQRGWSETRPMSIPEGARAERLRLVGWVQDRRGRILRLAQSHC